MDEKDIIAAQAARIVELEGREKVWGEFLLKTLGTPSLEHFVVRYQEQAARILTLEVRLAAAEAVCSSIDEYIRSGEFFDPMTTKAIYKWRTQLPHEARLAAQDGEAKKIGKVTISVRKEVRMAEAVATEITKRIKGQSPRRKSDQDSGSGDQP